MEDSPDGRPRVADPRRRKRSLQTLLAPMNRASCWMEGLKELIVVANVVLRIVGMRCQHHQHGVGRKPMLDCPDHRRHVQAEIRTIEKKLGALSSIIHNYGAASAYADEELMAFAMGMLSPNLLTGHFEDDKIALHKKRQRVLHLAKG